MWFFLVFDYRYFKKFINSYMEIDEKFVQYLQKAVNRNGFFTSEIKARDPTRYYHFLLSPLTSQDDDTKDDLEMFQHVYFYYHFPHEDVSLSGKNINITRIIFLSM